VLIKFADTGYALIPNGKNFLAKVARINFANFAVAKGINRGIPATYQAYFRSG